jgi:hypothetical protein
VATSSSTQSELREEAIAKLNEAQAFGIASPARAAALAEAQILATLASTAQTEVLTETVDDALTVAVAEAVAFTAAQAEATPAKPARKRAAKPAAEAAPAAEEVSA